MAENRYLDCKIFAKDAEYDATTAMLTTLLGGRFERHTMFLADVVVEVRLNPDTAAAEELLDDVFDFVRWPVLVELEAEEDAPGRTIVETTSKILQTLWDAGHPAVAACDFEDELPWGGGIRRLAR